MGAETHSARNTMDIELEDTAIAEAELLVLCLRGEPFPIAREIDWHSLLQLATDHGVLLLLHEAFLENAVQMPPFFAAAVEDRRNAAQRFAKELENLLQQFAEQDIEALPLKGPALAARLYGDVTMRSSVDLDLLVRRKDFPRAERLLSDLGFAAPAMADEYHRSFHRGGMHVELHFGIASPFTFPLDSFPFDLDEVWSRTQPGHFQGKPMRILSDDDLVLYLCLHGLKHGFARMIWIADIARALMRMRDCAPLALLQQARQRGLELPLLIGCEAVREALPQQFPPSMEAILAENSEAAERARRIVARLFVEGPGVSTDADIRNFYLQTEQSLNRRWRRRLSFFAPTPEDYAWAEGRRVHRGLAPLIRPFRLLQKYGLSRAWRILFPPPL